MRSGTELSQFLGIPPTNSFVHLSVALLFSCSQLYWSSKSMSIRKIKGYLLIAGEPWIHATVTYAKIRIHILAVPIEVRSDYLAIKYSLRNSEK